MDPNAAPATSRGTVNMVVTYIGTVILLCVGGIIGLAAAHIALPPTLDRATFFFGGSLVTLLVSTKSANPIPPKEIAAMPPVPPPAVTTTTTTEVHAPDATVTVDNEQLDPGA